MKYLNIILQSGKTVFSYQDIELLLSWSNKDTIKSFFRRWVKEGIFTSVAHGLYTLKKYERFELGTKLKKNSYVSFESVLRQGGIIFQEYGEEVFLASDNTLKKEVDGVRYTYRKIRNDILHNPLGIVRQGAYLIASKERAICDRLYLTPQYHFDSLDGIDMEKLKELSQIYNKRVIDTVYTLSISHAQ